LGSIDLNAYHEQKKGCESSDELDLILENILLEQETQGYLWFDYINDIYK
jgi:hypothetical protein